MVRVDLAVPLGVKVRLTGLTDQELQPGDGQAGGGDVLRETVPEKPEILVNEMFDIPVAPGLMVRLLGLAATVNSEPGQATADGRKKLSRPYCTPIA
jgi:hypothetical protein